MPAINKLGEIVIRLIYSRLLGVRLHAIYGEAELVMNLWPLEVVQDEGQAPGWVKEQVLAWAHEHQEELLAAWSRAQMRLTPFTVRA